MRIRAGTCGARRAQGAMNTTRNLVLDCLTSPDLGGTTICVDRDDMDYLEGIGPATFAYLNEVYLLSSRSFALAIHVWKKIIAVRYHVGKPRMGEAKLFRSALPNAACACYVLCCKFVETHIVRIEEIASFFGDNVTATAIRHQELQILQDVCWDVNITTAVDALHTIMTFAPPCLQALNEKAELYVKVGYCDPTLSNYPLSVIAVGSLLAASCDEFNTVARVDSPYLRFVPEQLITAECVLWCNSLRNWMRLCGR